MKQLSIEDWETIFRSLFILDSYDFSISDEEIRMKWMNWCEKYFYEKTTYVKENE